MKKLEPIYTEFASLLRGYRTQRRISQAELAERVSITAKFISLIEQDQARISLSNAVDILHALNVPQKDIAKLVRRKR